MKRFISVRTRWECVWHIDPEFIGAKWSTIDVYLEERLIRDCMDYKTPVLAR